MDLKNFFDNLDNVEKMVLCEVCSEYKREVAKKNAKTIILTEYEKSCLRNQETLAAIKAIRERTGHDLLTCKAATDSFLYVKRIR